MLNAERAVFKLYSGWETVHEYKMYIQTIYVEMRERMGQPGQRFFTSIKKVWRDGWGRTNLVFYGGCNATTFF